MTSLDGEIMNFIEIKLANLEHVDIIVSCTSVIIWYARRAIRLDKTHRDASISQYLESQISTTFKALSSYWTKYDSFVWSKTIMNLFRWLKNINNCERNSSKQL